MSTLVVYSDISDGYVAVVSETSYSLARSGVGDYAEVASVSDVEFTVGQGFDDSEPPDIWFVYEGFFSFDTSGIPDGDTVSAAVLNLTSGDDNSVNDFIIEARLYDWGASLTVDDFVPGADLSGDTLLASRNTSSGWTLGTAYDLTSESAFPTNVNKTGPTRICISSSRTRLGNTPGTSLETVTILSANFSGTTSDPKLTITHESGGVGLAVVLRRSI